MESFNELCLKWWDGFYSSFQNSCTMTCVSENGAIDMKHGEKSILLGIGGSETSHLFDSCGILDVDVIKFNKVLCQIEVLCLPKIMLMYEQYKSSLHLGSKEGDLIINSFQIMEDGSCQSQSGSLYSDSTTMSKADVSVSHLEIISAGDDLRFQQTSELPVSNDAIKIPAVAIEASQSQKNKHVENECNSVILKVLPSGGERETSEKSLGEKDDKTLNEPVKSDFAGVSNEQHLSNTNRGKEDVGVCSVISENRESTNENAAEQGGDFQQACQLVTKEMKIKEEAVENCSRDSSFPQNHINHIRRSSRQIRVSARFADECDVIRKLIKPEPAEATESKQSEKIPFICSVCKAGFTDPSVLKVHWESHKQSSKSLPFYCHKCELSFSSHKRVRGHRCSQSDQNETGAPDSNKGRLELDRNDPEKNRDIDDFVRKQNGAGAKDNNLEISECMKTSVTDKVHACETCSLSFKTKQLLEAHTKTHVNKPYKCDYCGKQFHRKKAFLCHKSKKHGDTSLQSAQSPKSFPESKAGEKHSGLHPGKKSFFCEVCGKGFYRHRSWLNHRRVHDRDNEFQCLQCRKCFQDKRSLEAHHSVHTGEKPHVCEVCGKRFRIVRGLINHSRLHDKNAHFKCDQCPKTFIEKRGLEAHKLAHSGVKPFSCNICGKTFRRELGLLNHLRAHDESKAIRCEVCQKSFVDKWGMLKHMSIHTGEKPFTCEICGKSFRIKKGLENHFKLHNKDLQYRCELCPRTFVEKRKLDIHVRAHRGEKAYVCDQCGQRFMNSMTLKVHKRRHTGEKPYKCSFCDKAFNQQGTLIAHERYHKGEKPYVCEVCGEGYVTKSHLTIHRRKHSNDRPYQCELCDYAAFTFSILRTHKLKHSSAKPFKCNLCTAAFKRPHHLEVHMRTHLSIEKSFRCQYCDEAFDCNKKFSAHLATHDIVVVTQHATSDAIFNAEVPREVAYDIVLLS